MSNPALDLRVKVTQGELEAILATRKECGLDQRFCCGQHMTTQGLLWWVTEFRRQQGLAKSKKLLDVAKSWENRAVGLAATVTEQIAKEASDFNPGAKWMIAQLDAVRAALTLANAKPTSKVFSPKEDKMMQVLMLWQKDNGGRDFLPPPQAFVEFLNALRTDHPKLELKFGKAEASRFLTKLRGSRVFDLQRGATGLIKFAETKGKPKQKEFRPGRGPRQEKS